MGGVAIIVSGTLLVGLGCIIQQRVNVSGKPFEHASIDGAKASIVGQN